MHYIKKVSEISKEYFLKLRIYRKIDIPLPPHFKIQQSW
jgi:hypothetical protein